MNNFSKLVGRDSDSSEVKKAKWLVTGAAGYVGVNVIDSLYDNGLQFIALDIRANELSEHLKKLGVCVRGSYGDSELIADLLKKVQGVIHLGALKNPYESLEKKELYKNNNFTLSRNLFDACVKFKVKNFIFASSAAVYGYSKNEPAREDDCLSPTTPYGQLKLQFEEYLIENAGSDCAITSLRLFNVAGVGVPGVVDTSTFSLIPQIVRRARADEPVIIFGRKYETSDGTAMRDYVHVTDIAQSFVNAAKKLDEGKLLSPVINIASGVGATVQEVVDSLAAVSGREIKTEIAPERPGDIGISIGDNYKAREELGWASSHSLQEIVRSAWEG